MKIILHNLSLFKPLDSHNIVYIRGSCKYVHVYETFFTIFFSKGLEREKNPGHKCVLAAINDKRQDNHSQNSGTYAIKG